MRCPSGKSSFYSQELAEEALIQNHIRNNHREGSGPQNVYECAECGEWHFTSRPPASDIFSQEGVLKRIHDERRSLEWERRMRPS